MSNELRKVTFQLLKDGYMPLSAKEEQQKKEDEKPRDGYFHRWIEDVDSSRDIPRITVHALIEDIKTGKLYAVDYWNVTFKTTPENKQS